MPKDLPSVVDDSPTVILKKNFRNNDFYIEVYKSNDIVSGAIQTTGSWESSQVDSIADLYEEYAKEHSVPLQDLTFIDIGSNVGWYSLSLAAMGVQVIAFEAMQDNANIMKHALALKSNVNSGLSQRVTLFEHGLGKEPQDCFIYSDMGNVGDGHVSCVAREADIQMDDNYKVRGKTRIEKLDDVIDLTGKTVLAIKMDAEGSEVNILEGGTHTFLQSNIPVIMSEFNLQSIKEKGSDPMSFMTKMRDAGYSALKYAYGSADYFSSEEMTDMNNFGSNMLTLHSFTKKNETITKQKAEDALYEKENADWMDNETDHYYRHDTEVYYEEDEATNSTSKNPTVKKYNKDKQFAIEVYAGHDIVSSAIRSSYASWETDTVDALTKMYEEYSQKHDIPITELTFVDIGSNIGWLSLNLAAIGVNVIAFEPMKENIALFKRSLNKKLNKENGISDRITFYEHGLGVKNETCYLYSDNENVGDGHVKCVASEEEVHVPANYTLRETVPLKRLDDVIPNPESMHIVAIKMDTEGSEGNVLEGGSKLILGGSVDCILSEFVPDWLKEKGADPVAFMQNFIDAGYRVKKKQGWGYMKKSDMLNMTTFGLEFGDLQFHSPGLVNEFIGQ